MPQVEFVAITDARYNAEILAMMEGLYAEDVPSSPVDQSRFPVTIGHFLANPARGRIVVFKEHDLVRGYALLVPYWSNEFGGTLLFVDELFVVPGARNRGIARSFFQFIEKERLFDAIALWLEVNPSNTGARRLYESLGFTPRKHSVLTYTFRASNQT